MPRKYYQRKYKNPADRLIALSQPKSDEHKKRISEGQKRYWKEARAALAKMNKSALFPDE